MEIIIKIKTKNLIGIQIPLNAIINYNKMTNFHT